MEEQLNAYLTFQTGDNTFAVSVNNVVEILEYQEPKTRQTTLPYLKGLIEHRDGVVPLIDSGIKFGLSPIEVNEQTCTVVLAVNPNMTDEFHVAIVVDYVSDIIEVQDENKQSIASSYKPGYVAFAVKASDEKMVLAIDVDKVFTDTDIICLKNLQ
ncbi:MAG: chemotaxis protein CheW [Bacteroidales bacterium]|nr:chemotaxis protein CheW [Bacteroidales bacterium]